MNKNANYFNVVSILRAIVAILFLYAGITKLINPHVFAEDIDNYRMLPYLFVTLMAVILPWFEVISAVGLFLPRMRSASSFSIFAMTFMFVIAIATAVIRGLDISCGCFVSPGETNSVSYTRLCIEIIFLILTFIVYYQTVQSSRADSN